MNKIIRLTSVILVLMFSLTMLFACTDNNGNKPTYEEDPDKTLAETNILLANNGTTDYKIVLPENPQKKELVARNELVEFLGKATGATFAVVSDNGLIFNPQDKYISVGNTEILATSGVAVEQDKLTSDGYRIVTKGNTVIIAGPSDYGTLYGAYAFLNWQIGFETYAEDEVYYETKTQLKLLKFDEAEAPDFEKRQLGYYTAWSIDSYRDRLRVERHGKDWIYGSHSHFTILPKSTYYAQHRDWYSSDGTQLCLTNEEMRKEFVARLKYIISSHPDEHYILLGAEDVNSFCYCDNCKKAIAKYGTESGVDMVFVNKVARDINAWLEQTDPDRFIYIGTFAYNKTIPAPVKKNADGEYVPTHVDVVAEPNVFIYFAPLGANFSYGFLDEEHNSEIAQSMLGWKVICPTFCIWTYSANFFNYFTNFNNWGTQALQYRELKSVGGKVIFDMGTWDTAAPSFERLRSYVTAKLMWDTEADTQKLIADFMQHYYKDAAEYMTKYYDLMRSYLEVIRVENNMDATCYVNYNNVKYWSKAYVDTCMSYFEQAFATVEKYKQSDPTLYESLIKRIKMEKLSVLFVALQHYQQTYTPSQQKAMIDEFEEVAKANNVMYWHEHTNLAQGDDGAVDKRINAWRLSIGE